MFARAVIRCVAFVCVSLFVYDRSRMSNTLVSLHVCIFGPNGRLLAIGRGAKRWTAHNCKMSPGRGRSRLKQSGRPLLQATMHRQNIFVLFRSSVLQFILAKRGIAHKFAIAEDRSQLTKRVTAHNCTTTQDFGLGSKRETAHTLRQSGRPLTTLKPNK